TSRPAVNLSVISLPRPSKDAEPARRIFSSNGILRARHVILKVVLKSVPYSWVQAATKRLHQGLRKQKILVGVHGPLERHQGLRAVTAQPPTEARQSQDRRFERRYDVLGRMRPHLRVRIGIRARNTPQNFVAYRRDADPYANPGQLLPVKQ